MPTVVATYKSAYLIFILDQEDYDDIFKEIKDDITPCNVEKMTRDLELIKSEINRYKLSNINKTINQEEMIRYIATKIPKSYMEILTLWMYNIIKLIELEHVIMDEQTNYFTFEDNDELTIMYRSILHNSDVL
jgi:hypothetical protein